MNINFKQNYFFWIVIGLVLIIDIPLVLWMQNNLRNNDNKNETLQSIKPLDEMLMLNGNQEDLFNKYIKEYYKSADTLDMMLDSLNMGIVNGIFGKNYNQNNLTLLIENAGKINIKAGKLRLNYLRKLRDLLDKNQQIKFKKIVNESFAERRDTLMYDKNRLILPHPRKIF